MQALGGFANAYYQDAFEIEVYIEEGDAVARDAAFDELLQQPRKELSGAAGGRRRKTARILKVSEEPFDIVYRLAAITS